MPSDSYPFLYFRMITTTFDDMRKSGKMTRVASRLHGSPRAPVLPAEIEINQKINIFDVVNSVYTLYYTPHQIWHKGLKIHNHKGGQTNYLFPIR